MTQYPIFVICRDRLTYLRRLLSWLEAAGQERIVLVDNESVYPPLLEFYEETRHEVVRCRNFSFCHLSPWLSGVVCERARGEHYVVTDPDVVPSEECPLDALDHLRLVLDRHAEVEKAALGLRIDDLPDCFAHKGSVLAWEAQFWKNPAEPGVFRAMTDTTFALYRPGCRYDYSAVRTGPPYVARHLTWYEDSASPTDEVRFYRSRIQPGTSTWSEERIPEWLEEEK